jgi:hypothetical protein
MSNKKEESPDSDMKSNNSEIHFIEIEPENLISGKSPNYELDKTPFDTIVIRCADPRFQNAFKKFIIEELDLKHYAPIIIGGGIHPFGSQKEMPTYLESLWGQLSFFINAAKLKQIIFINHEDCKWYHGHKEHYPDSNLSEKGKKDLLAAKEHVHNEFPDVIVRTFWAGIKDDRIYFTELKNK